MEREGKDSGKQRIRDLRGVGPTFSDLYDVQPSGGTTSVIFYCFDECLGP